MVTEFGMSEKLGSVRYAGQQLQYLGSAVQDNSQLSPQTAGDHRRRGAPAGDRAVGTGARTAARAPGALENLAERLLTQETVDGTAADEALEAEMKAGEAGRGNGGQAATDETQTVAGVKLPKEGQVIAEAPGAPSEA